MMPSQKNHRHEQEFKNKAVGWRLTEIDKMKSVLTLVTRFKMSRPFSLSYIGLEFHLTRWSSPHLCFQSD